VKVAATGGLVEPGGDSSISPSPPFGRAFSSADREALAPVFARQYLGAGPVTLTGGMTVWRRHGFLGPVLRVLARFGLVFPETGDDVPTTLRITPRLDRAGRMVQEWQRTFSFPGADRRFDGVVAWDARLGQVAERLGPGGLIESPFELFVRPGGLRIEAKRLRLRIGRWGLTLPSGLAATVVVDQSTEASDPELIHVNVKIANRLTGQIFGYEGSMRIADEHSVGLAAPRHAHARPSTSGQPTVIDRLFELAPKHPVGMTTDYRTVALLNYAIAPDALRRLVPAELDLDISHDHGFVTVVCADMVRMRPSPLPHLLGITYDQVVYRVPVRYQGEPGLFFLGSDAGQQLMVAAGAAFSMFGVRLSKTKITDAGDRVTIDVFGRTPGVDFHAYLKVQPDAQSLPDASLFVSKSEAQSFLVDRFVAFVPSVDGRPMRRVRVRRGTWDVLLPSATDVRSDILDGSRDFPVGSARLDNAFVARDIPYHWFAAEVERAPGDWRRPRLSLPDSSG
jgi:uncharacterized protein YqjF (DUF2071 family)